MLVPRAVRARLVAAGERRHRLAHRGQPRRPFESDLRPRAQRARALAAGHRRARPAHAEEQRPPLRSVRLPRHKRPSLAPPLAGERAEERAQPAPEGGVLTPLGEGERDVRTAQAGERARREVCELEAALGEVAQRRQTGVQPLVAPRPERGAQLADLVASRRPARAPAIEAGGESVEDQPARGTRRERRGGRARLDRLEPVGEGPAPLAQRRGEEWLAPLAQ